MPAEAEAVTLMGCGHPHAERWVEVCGPVEVCRVCSECRDGRLAGSFWPVARRRLETRDGRRLMYGKHPAWEGEVLFQSRLASSKNGEDEHTDAGGDDPSPRGADRDGGVYDHGGDGE